MRKNSFCDYICTKCTKTLDGNFDYEKSLKRLEKYSLSGNLEAGARVERILLRNENCKPLSSRNDFNYQPSSSLATDRVSKLILENHKITFDGKSPAHVSGDGNCLFNSLSVGLVGHEKLAPEIRVKTCLEMFFNRHAYYDGPNVKEMKEYFWFRTIMTRHVTLLLGTVLFRPRGQCLRRRRFWVAPSSLCILPEMVSWTEHFVI